MRSRPPKPKPPPDEAALDAFISGAGGDEAPAVQASGGGSARLPTAAPERPWEADRVREDVRRGVPLRLPEPLYLRLKWAAKETGRSMNKLCEEAIVAEIKRSTTGSGL
jgi:hypothetical protein